MDPHSRLGIWAGRALFAALAGHMLATPLSAQQPGVRASQTVAQAAPLPDPGYQTGLRGSAVPDGGAGGGNLVGAQPWQVVDFDRSTIGNDGETPPGAAESAGDIAGNDNLAQVDPDMRLQKDRDAFEQPPAGHNPKLFQIERLEPLKDRRTAEFFEEDPFPHLGWRLGSFVLFQELSVSAAWDSNVFYESNARADWRANFDSETRLVSDWANHALEFRMVHNRSYHRNFSSENDAGQIYELRGRLDVTRRTNVEAAYAHEIAQESRSSIDASGFVTNGRPDVTTDRVTGALNHRFNRLSLQLRGGQSETSYEPVAPGGSNNRDVQRRTITLRGQWEFRPAFSVFGEVEHDTRRHAGVTTTDGLTRSSNGERYRAGVALGQTGEFLRGEASIGYGIQRPDAGRLPDVEAFLVDANVAWRVTRLTSLLFDARTAFNETTLAGSPGVIDRRIGIKVRHSFLRRLVAEAGVSYATQDYPGSSLKEHSVTFNSSVEYSFNRHAALFGRLEHVRFRSNAEARDYDASTIMIGARLRN